MRPAAYSPASARAGSPRAVSSPFFHEQEAKDGNVKRIREGEVAATAIVVATGAAVALRGNQPVALWASIAISAVFIAGYERAIRKPATEEGKSKSAKGSQGSGVLRGRAW